MKEKIKTIIKKHKILRKMATKARYIIKNTIYKTTAIKGVDEKLVVFEAFMGRKYVDSPKAIYLEMIKDKRFKDYKFVWAFKDIEKAKYFNNKNTSVVKYGSKDFVRTVAKAKYIFSNSRLPDYIKINKNQVFVQCWHGTPLKKLGYDITVKGENAKLSNKELRYKYLTDAKKFSYLVAPSKVCGEKLSTAFNLKSLNKENCVIETGYPRNDFLINYKNTDVNKIKKELGIPKNKRVVLYAPTWRENAYNPETGYVYDLHLDFDKLKKEIGKDSVVLFRAHYFISNSFNFDKYEGFIYNVSDYEDVNDLYIISDVLITDYSSVFFDYANLKRPMIFYMYDFDEYKNNMRDFYFDLEILPGPIVKEEEDLFKELKNNDFDKYKEKYKKFNDMFNYLDDGKSAKRVIDIVFDVK